MNKKPLLYGLVIILSLQLVSADFELVSNASLRSYYKLDNYIAGNKTINSYNNTDLMNVTYLAVGKIDNASYGTGYNGYGISNYTVGIVTTAARTLNYWIKVNSTNVDQAYVGWGATSPDGRGFMGTCVGGKHYLDGAGSYNFNSNSLCASGWEMITWQLNGGVISFYKNGTWVANKSVALTTTDSRLYVGWYVPSTYFTRPANASIDEVGVWSRRLNDTEIMNLYNSGVGLSFPFAEAVTPPASPCTYLGSGNWLIGNTSCNITVATNLLKNNLTIYNSTVRVNVSVINYTIRTITLNSIVTRIFT